MPLVTRTLLLSLLLIGYAGALLPFRNISLSWEERVDDLVSRLTLKEMVLQLGSGGGVTSSPEPAIPRLGIGSYQFDTECLHGVMDMKTTTFPQAIGLSASFRYGRFSS